jgi:hypothetical protein
LILAQKCLAWGENIGAAQLFIRILLWSSQEGASHTENIAAIKQLTNIYDPKANRIDSFADFHIYCYVKIRNILSEEGLSATEQSIWIRQAINSEADNDREKSKIIYKRLKYLIDDSNRASNSFAELKPDFILEIMHQFSNSRFVFKSRLNNLNHYAIQVAFLISIIFITLFLLYNGFEIDIPNETGLIFGYGSTFFSILNIWPILLILTWFFALMVSRQSESFDFINPSNYWNPNSVQFGEVKPFKKDWFFHIFQFFWIPFLAICFVLLAKVDPVSMTIIQMWDTSANDVSAQVFLESWNHSQHESIGLALPASDMVRNLLLNDISVLALGFVTGLLGALNQIRIQFKRYSTGVDMYWWDWRINKIEYIVRLFMVFLDLFLAIVVLCKVFALIFLSFDVMSNHILQVKFFHPDGVGGFEALSAVFRDTLWLVFVFGFFVMASLYLHKNLEEYRMSDLFLVAAYVVLVLIAMLPLISLEFRLNEAQDAVFSRFNGDGLFGEISVSRALSVAEQLSALRGWQVSSLDFGIFSGPIIPLVSQAAIILVQYVLSKNASHQGGTGGYISLPEVNR